MGITRKQTGEREILLAAELEKDPEVPTMTLAKRFAKKNGELFASVEIARSWIRHRRGEAGEKARATRKIVAPAKKRRVSTPIGNIVPKADKESEKTTPYNLKLKGHGSIMSDIHFPYHDEVALTAALEHSQKIGATDWIILNGDIMDFYQASCFNKNPNTRDIDGELDMVCEFLKKLSEHYGRVIFKLGNHEKRFQSYLFANAPQIANLKCLTFEKLFKAHELGVEIVQPQQVMHSGKHLTILHGHEFGRSFFNPVNAARGAFMRAKASAIVGHLHQTSDHTDSDIRNKVISCWSGGCLCALNPAYSPINNWNHGYITAHIDNSHFEVSNHRIIEGRVY